MIELQWADIEAKLANVVRATQLSDDDAMRVEQLIFMCRRVGQSEGLRSAFNTMVQWVADQQQEILMTEPTIPTPASEKNERSSMRFIARRFTSRGHDDTPIDCHAVAVQDGDRIVELCFDNKQGVIRIRTPDGTLSIQPECANVVAISVVTRD